MSTRLRSEKYHLTYKTHLPQDEYLSFIKSKGGIKMISFVHEVGDDDETDATPYEHTHVFVWFTRPLDSIDQRFFDFQNIHPNFVTYRSIKWAKGIILKYHHGHKTKKDGKKYFIEPVHLYQEGCEEWKMENDAYEIATHAPTLIDAALDLGIEIKSIADIKTVRNEKKRDHAQLDDDLDKDMFKKIDPWPTSFSTGRVKAIIGRGPTGIGKTNWAIAQFRFPYKINDIDELKDMPPETDGIIFDECLFDRVSKKVMVCLTDYNQPTTVRIRHTLAYIPAKIKKIFLCNEHEHPFGWDPATGGSDAVLDRVQLMELTKDSVRADPEDIEPDIGPWD